MVEDSKYLRVLVAVMGRINAVDSANNGLLLRNLFGSWPRDKVAQIYSSGDTGDEGFFGHYYKLGPQDRRLGKLFYRLKTDVSNAGEKNTKASGSTAANRRMSLSSLGKRLLVDTGIYELIFAPHLSPPMRAWVEEFRPDVILAQGYNLTFTWLPLMLSKNLGIPICYYPTDDWPCDLYRLDGIMSCLLSWPARCAVARSSRKLARRSAVRVAFNPAMQQEYSARYQCSFAVLMHGDDPARFAAAAPKRLAASDELWIVSTGVFDRHRWPLLRDLDRACAILAAAGRRVRATIFPVNRPSDSAVQQERFRYVEFAPCPSHDDLAAVLRGADALFLPERFDAAAKLIKLSVSSKAHLFMFSGKPIVVYSHPVTGITRYAQEGQWAAVVDRQDPALLARAFERLISDEDDRKRVVASAWSLALANHNLPIIQASFRQMLCSALQLGGAMR